MSNDKKNDKKKTRNMGEVRIARVEVFADPEGDEREVLVLVGGRYARTSDARRQIKGGEVAGRYAIVRIVECIERVDRDVVIPAFSQFTL